MSFFIEPQSSLCALEEQIGWTFKDIQWLIQALTHPTYAHEHPGAGGAHYERLEFIGDAVLNMVAAELLFKLLPQAAEGELSRRRSCVVRQGSLKELAQEIHLEDFVRLGEGAKQQAGHLSARILADAYEALIGAVYLDGGYEAASRCFSKPLQRAMERSQEGVDFKTSLQEACHQRKLASPSYAIVAVEGPEHAKLFTCEVKILGKCYGRGQASSKKEAEQICAQLALKQLETAL